VNKKYAVVMGLDCE